jgi:hypothetical protein
MSMQGLNRGVFGVPVAKRNEIEKLLMLLEEQNPVHNPTENLQMVNAFVFQCESGFRN